MKNPSRAVVALALASLPRAVYWRCPFCGGEHCLAVRDEQRPRQNYDQVYDPRRTRITHDPWARAWSCDFCSPITGRERCRRRVELRKAAA
jgi:hypothetical protein